MEITNHVRIANDLIQRLNREGLAASTHISVSGSVYVNIIGSTQVVRIADHRKHRGWFRYNVRSDLKQSREFVFSHERVYVYTEADIKRAAFRISRDFKNRRIATANAIIHKIRIRR